MGDKGASSSSSAQAEQPKPQSIAHYVNKLKQGDNATWEKVRIIPGLSGVERGGTGGATHSYHGVVGILLPLALQPE